MNATGKLTIGLVRWNADYTKQAGVTTISLSLARAWQKLGCEIVWIGPSLPPEFSNLFTYIESEPTTSGLIQGVLHALTKHSIDLLVTFEPFTEGPAAARVKDIEGIPFAHFGMHFANQDDSSLAIAEDETYNSADIIIYQCHWFLDNYVFPKFGVEFVHNKPYIVVPFGVDTAVFAPKHSEKEEAEYPTLLFNGRLNRENCPAPEYDKGAKYLVQAIPSIVKQYKNLKVKFIGDGPQLPLLQDDVRTTNITNNVEFLGELHSRHTLLQHLRSASVFVLPSVCDVFPVAIVEAMAAGLPIISTTVGGIPECVDDSCGILVEPARPGLLADTVMTLLADKALRHNMGRQARVKAAADYDWDIAAAKSLTAFRELGIKS